MISADGLHVFASRQIIGHLLRDTTSKSPYIACPGSNQPCVITDPLSGISDNITLLQSNAKSWYDGLIASIEHKPAKLGQIGYQYSISYTLSKTFDYYDDDQLTASADAATVIVAIMPLRLIAPRMVTICQSPSGVPSWMRAPPRQRAKRRVIVVEMPLSSRKTSFFGSIARMRWWNSARRMRLASVSRSTAWSDFF